MKKINLKNLLVFGVFMVAGTTFLAPKVSAGEYAYSIGSKYAAGTSHAGDDFTKNVAVAADAYGWLKGYTSYYAYTPTYSYIADSNGSFYRLGGSSVYFINGHGNYNVITAAGKNELNYRTGITLYSNGTYNLGQDYKLAGLEGRSMSKTKLITFAGCLTGSGSSNLVTKAVSQGAKSAVGFREEITSRYGDGPNWLKRYNYTLGNGVTIARAIEAATNAYPGSDLGTYVVTAGNTSTTLGTLGKSAAPKLNNIQERNTILAELDDYKEIKISDNHISINPSIVSFTNEDPKQHEDLLSNIISSIKNEDELFDINDYKVSYNLVNSDESYAHIKLTYYIDGKIETNKVYFAVVRGEEITSLTLAGVKEQNIENTLNVKNNTLISNVNSFEKVKAEKIMSKAESNKIFKNSNILENNNINVKALNSNISKAKEKYYYDYNTNELKYQLVTFEKNNNIVNDGELLEIIIK